MDYFNLISVLVFLISVKRNLAGENITDDEAKRREEIAALEKKKSELYLQINDAIDDSVKNLAETNDTDAKLGISYITDLKKQIKELNGTNDTSDNAYGMTLSELLKVDGRKSNVKKPDIRSTLKKGKYRKADSSGEFEDLLLKKKDKSAKYQERFVNRIAMEKRVAEWLHNRTLAKKLKKAKKDKKKKKYEKWEECPNYGLQKPKKGKGKKKSKSGDDKYPCCRKCCKSSYLGCL